MWLDATPGPQAVADEMKNLGIREMRTALSRLDEIVGREGEIVVTRRGRALARVLPMRPRRAFPSHADLRARVPRLAVGSEVLIREDRDSR